VRHKLCHRQCGVSIGSRLASAQMSTQEAESDDPTLMARAARPGDGGSQLRRSIDGVVAG
jgi:hypothetical protein